MSIEQTCADTITPSECVATLKNEGVLLVRDFIPPTEQQEIVDEVLSHELTTVDRSGHTIPEQFQDIGWLFSQAPTPVNVLGKRIMELVRPELPQWFMNQVRAQLYSPGEVGIEWHRDYKRDLRVIAIASFIGQAYFEARLQDGQEIGWEVNPGDLVLMRGTLLNGRVDDRPPHRVEAPKIGQRLSVAYRQVVQEVPDLEEPHE